MIYFYAFDFDQKLVSCCPPPEENGMRTCSILGLPENVRLARQLIMKTIDEQPVIEVSEIKVPNVSILL